MISRHRMAVWAGGCVLLLILNIGRDVRWTLARYEWQPVQFGTLHRGIATVGVMQATKVAEIKSEVDETVEKKMVEEGQPVKEKQLLLELSQTRTKLDFNQQRNAYNSAEADFKKATRELAVQKKLLKDLAVSRSQVEDTEQALARAEAAFAIAKQQLDLAQEKLDSTHVRSPIDGVVLKDYTTLGESVSAGKNIITIGDISKFIVRAKVDELDIQQVAVGQPVDIVAEAFPDRPMKGVLRSIATQAERDTFAKIEVVIEIVDSNGLALKHNLSVRINILTEDIPNAIGIPARAVFKKEANTAWVLVRSRLNFIRKKKIKLGKTAGDNVQVLSGLKKGQRVGIEKPPVPRL